MQNSGLTICVPQQKLSFIGPDYISPVFSWPLLVSLCPLQPHICLCGRQEGSPARPSAAEHNFHFEMLFCSPKLASTFCQLQLVIKGQHKIKKNKKEVKPMPANPGRLVVSEKLKPSGTTSTVSDNSFPLVLVFGIINQLVCAHLYRNPIHLLKHCSRHSFDCLKGNKYAALVE